MYPPVRQARLRWIPDTEPYDDSYLETWDDLSPEELETERRRLYDLIDREGVWVRVAEVQCPCCGVWSTMSSIGGLVGRFDDSDEDLKHETEHGTPDGVTFEWTEV